MHIRISKPVLLPIGTGGAGLTIGVIAGYGFSHILSQRKIKELEQSFSELQVNMVKLGNILKERTDTLNKFTEKLHEAIREDQAVRDQHPSVSVLGQEELPLVDNDNPMRVLKAAKVISIFPEETLEPWDQEKENKERARFQGRPYQISVEEFQENESGFPQQTVTYFEGDEVLTDPHDVPVYNHTNVVGEFRFGYGSGDPNVAYVRNVRGKVEYEILRDSGHYSVEVLGQTIESEHAEADLKHSGNHRLRRDD